MRIDIYMQEFHGVIDHFIDKHQTQHQKKYKIDRSGGMYLCTCLQIHSVKRDLIHRDKGGMKKN